MRPPQPPPPPPLRIRQQAPPLPTPPPLILRERPPVPPASVASQTGKKILITLIIPHTSILNTLLVVRRLAALPVPPRSVIIERLPAQPARPRSFLSFSAYI